MISPGRGEGVALEIFILAFSMDWTSVSFLKAEKRFQVTKTGLELDIALAIVLCAAGSEEKILPFFTRYILPCRGGLVSSSALRLYFGQEKMSAF